MGSSFGNGARQFLPAGQFRGRGRAGRTDRGRVGVGRATARKGATEVVALSQGIVEAQVMGVAAALMPVATQLVQDVEKATSRTSDPCVGESGYDTQVSKKVDKGRFYRCGFPGHVLADCKTEICDICESAAHVSENCALLAAPKPQVEIYGHYCDDLTFFWYAMY